MSYFEAIDAGFHALDWPLVWSLKQLGLFERRPCIFFMQFLRI